MNEISRTFLRKDIKLNFWRGFADCIEKEGIKTWGGGGDRGFIISGFILKKKLPTPTVASLFQENSYGKQKILIVNHNK